MNTAHQPKAVLHRALAYDEFNRRMGKAVPAVALVLALGLARLLRQSARENSSMQGWQAVLIVGLVAVAFATWFLVSRRRLKNEAAWFDAGGLHVRSRDGKVASYELTAMEHWPNQLVFSGSDPSGGVALSRAWPLARLAAEAQQRGVPLVTQTGTLAALQIARPQLVLYGDQASSAGFNSWYEQASIPVKMLTTLAMTVGFILVVAVAVNVVVRL